MWIELDKFRQSLQRGLNVIWRPAKLASVIKKPATKPPGGQIVRPINADDTNPDPETNYCGCGWPYNLLIPRGSRKGMAFEMP